MGLRAPFPWFGGKSRAAGIIWPRFGNVVNYVEPFAGSLAVLLMRPHEPKNETVNDKDCFLANFWRALARDPEQVAHYADWPVNEADLTARHRWLCGQKTFQEQKRRKPEYCDAKIAGWWVWGLCQWIGGEWCSKPEWNRQHAGQAERGVNKRPRLARGERGVNKRPLLLKGGAGVNSRVPQIAFPERRPHLSGSMGVINPLVLDWFLHLQERMRRVRVCCGDWRRVVTPSVTTLIGRTAVMLDPPYGEETGRDMRCYAVEDGTIAKNVREWAIANGEDPLLRIALCGYAGEHAMPANWECVAWKAHGGYGAAGKGRAKDNCQRERIWFSPHCLKPSEVDLFAGMDVAHA